MSAEVMERTRTWNKDCRCEEEGLHVGMPVDELIELESGCTGTGHIADRGWVCHRLDMIRRAYGR